jgi:hypothetical protein
VLSLVLDEPTSTGAALFALLTLVLGNAAAHRILEPSPLLSQSVGFNA